MKKSLFYISSLFLIGCAQQASILNDEVRISLSPRILWGANSILQSVNGSFGNGFVETQYTDDDEFIQTMRLNLLPQEDGKYEAWLIRDHPFSKVLLGTLQSEKQYGSYFLEYKKLEDLRDHRRVMVIWVPSKASELEQHSQAVVEGILQVVHSNE